MPRQNNKNLLKTWLFDKPMMFALLTCGISFVIISIYAIISNLFEISTKEPLVILLITILTGIYSMYYTIKRLPHTPMARPDFIAITNACGFLIFLIPFITLLFVGPDPQIIRHKALIFYVLHPVAFWFVSIGGLILYLYVGGLAVSSIYAKYRRAVQLGISKWKVILSMPFAFLLMWTPGYLVEENKTKSNMQINSPWYARFNQWVITDILNTFFVYLVLLLMLNIFAGFPTILLTAFLLMVYTLWNLKFKNGFLKNINRGYSLTAVAINLIFIITILAQNLIQG